MTGAKPLLLVVAAALVDVDGRVLICKRPEGKSMGGLWEFPGGKVEAGESPEACLIRELKEELDIEVTGACLSPFVFASHAYDHMHLLMPLYLLRRWSGVIRPLEHSALAWVKPMEMGDYPMPPADEPLVAWLRDLIYILTRAAGEGDQRSWWRGRGYALNQKRRTVRRPPPPPLRGSPPRKRVRSF